jgi:hypothetical protein
MIKNFTYTLEIQSCKQYVRTKKYLSVRRAKVKYGKKLFTICNLNTETPCHALTWNCSSLRTTLTGIASKNDPLQYADEK